MTALDRLLARVRERGAMPLARLGMQRPLADSLIASGILATRADADGALYVYIPYDWPSLKRPKPDGIFRASVLVDEPPADLYEEVGT